ncbi:MAG: hypothetical protein DRI24_18940, partial [Deltaproteobacteria bacterium]
MLACVLFFTGANSIALAQKPTTSTTDTPATEPRVIPSTEIVKAASEISDRLKIFRDDVKPQAFVADIDTQVVALSKEIEELREKTDVWLASELTLSALEEVQRDWDRYAETLTSWAAQLDTRVSQLQEQLAEIADERPKWRNTQAAAAETELSQALVHVINNVLVELGDTQKLIESRIESVTQVQQKVSEKEKGTAESLETIRSAVEEARSGLFVRNQPPIWKVFHTAPEALTHAEEFGESWEWVVSAIDKFFKTFETRIISHIIIFVCLLVLLIVLRFRSAKWELDATSRQTVDHVFHNPVATSFLIFLVLSRPLYPDAPTVIFELTALLTVPILALLVPRLLPRVFLKSAYGLFAVVVFFPILDLLAVSGLLTRLFMFTLSGGVLAILAIWSRTNGPTINITHPKGRAFALFAARLGAVFMLISFAANIVGMVLLADFLFSGTLVTAYGAILIFVSYRILGVLAIVSLNSNFAQTFASIRKNRYRLKSSTIGFLRLAAVLIWLAMAFRWFGILDIVTSTAVKWFSTQWTVGSMTISLGSIAAFIIALWLSVLVSRFVRTILKEDVLPKARLARGMPESISLIVNYAIITIGFIVALAAAGIELSQFAIVFGAFGVGIGFGLQTIVNNFISGLILIFERPIQVGDTIEMGNGGLVGVVRQIGIRASTIRTFAGAEVIVPNGDLVAGQVTNWTLSDANRRITVEIGVAYGNNPQQIIDLLLDVANQRDDLLEDPKPNVIFKGFGESSLDFELRAWTASDNWFSLKSELTIQVHDSIVGAGIVIPFPQRDVYLRSMDPAVGESKTPKDEPRDPA